MQSMALANDRGTRTELEHTMLSRKHEDYVTYDGFTCFKYFPERRWSRGSELRLLISYFKYRQEVNIVGQEELNWDS